MGSDNTTGELAEALKLSAKAVSDATDLAKNLLGEPFRVAGEISADQLRMWQWRNRIRMLARASEILKEKSIAARVVPPGFLMRLLEAAGDAAEPELRERWARLLANGVASDSNQHPMFVETLRRMTVDDAEMFESLCQERVRQELGAAFLTEAPVARLIALGLVDAERPALQAQMREDAVYRLRVSHFGREFAKAVGAPRGP